MLAVADGAVRGGAGAGRGRGAAVEGCGGEGCGGVHEEGAETDRFLAGNYSSGACDAAIGDDIGDCRPRHSSDAG